MTKRQYNYSYEQKAKIASRKLVKEKEKEIAKLKKNLENKTRRLRDKKEALKVTPLIIFLLKMKVFLIG